MWQQWELYPISGGDRELLQESDSDGDPIRLTLQAPLELGSQYEAVVHVADTAGSETVYPFSFQAVLDPPRNLVAAAKPNKT